MRPVIPILPATKYSILPIVDPIVDPIVPSIHPKKGLG